MTLRDSNHTEAALLIAVGAALLVTGLVAASAFWLIPQQPHTAWRFTAVQLTVSELPLLSVGAILVCVGLFKLKLDPGWTRVAAAGFGLLALIMLVLAIAFVPSVSAAMAQAPPESLSVVQRDIISSLAALVVFALAFLGSGAILWQAVERNGR